MVVPMWLLNEVAVALGAAWVSSSEVITVASMAVRIALAAETIVALAAEWVAAAAEPETA